MTITGLKLPIRVSNLTWCFRFVLKKLSHLKSNLISACVKSLFWSLKRKKYHRKVTKWYRLLLWEKFLTTQDHQNRSAWKKCKIQSVCPQKQPSRITVGQIDTRLRKIMIKKLTNTRMKLQTRMILILISSKMKLTTKIKPRKSNRLNKK